MRLDIKETREYMAIEEDYSRKVTSIYKIPFMRHIEQGLKILDYRDQPLVLQQAFCVMPFVQQASRFNMFRNLLSSFNGEAVALAVEFRAMDILFMPYHVALNRKPGTAKRVPVSPSITGVEELIVANSISRLYTFEKLHSDKTDQWVADYRTCYDSWLSKIGVTPHMKDVLMGVLKDV